MGAKRGHDTHPTCAQRGHLDIIFTTVDSEGKAAKREGCKEAEADEFNETNSLNRQELIRLLVRVAIARYVLDGQIPKVGAAVEALFEQHLVPFSGEEEEEGEVTAPAHNSNWFREKHCYIQSISDVLEANEEV